MGSVLYTYISHGLTDTNVAQQIRPLQVISLFLINMLVGFRPNFQKKKTKISIFLLPLIGFSEEIITSFPQKISKKHLGQGMAGSVKDPST